MNKWDALSLSRINQDAPTLLLRFDVFAGRVMPIYGHKGRYQLAFTFTGERELAKYNIDKTLRECFQAHQCQFYASARNPRNCYVIFSIRS